jgi:ABC-2 type transport system permease protein
VTGFAITVRELLVSEWLKVRTTRTSIALAIAALLLTVGPVLLVLLLVSTDEIGSDGFAEITLLGALTGLVALVWGILGMAGEFRHGTITYTILATPRRWRVIVLKLGFYFVFGAILAIVALLVIQLLCAIVPALRGGSALWAARDDLGYLGRVVLTTGLFGAFGVALAALLRSQVLTLVLTLVWIILELMIASPILMATGHSQIAAWLPLQVFSQVTGTPFNADTGGEAGLGIYTMSSTMALGVGVSYIAIAAIAAVFTTMRRDVA